MGRSFEQKWNLASTLARPLRAICQALKLRWILPRRLAASARQFLLLSSRTKVRAGVRPLCLLMPRTVKPFKSVPPPDPSCCPSVNPVLSPALVQVVARAVVKDITTFVVFRVGGRVLIRIGWPSGGAVLGAFTRE